ncbi:MAG TPA: hypothetical protein VG269_17475 [Tepidisphaeraceae bacterium]|jgi:hypothetical protein|nr:hypothetical protein [Tepidisphaeraceae bacterium]
MDQIEVRKQDFGFTRNTWDGLQAYLEKHRELKPKIMLSGTPPLTITSGSIRVESISTSTDHVGTSIVVTYNAQYVGTFDPIYLTASASTLGFPWYGDYASGASGLVYCSHTAINWFGGNGTTASPGVFRYVATFSPITPDRLDLSPLSRPAIVTGGGIELTEVRRQDVNGNPIVNAVGDFYENLPEFYVPGCELQVSWNVSSNPMATAQTYSFTTNSAAIWGQAAYSGVIGKITAEETFETYSGTLIQYWRITVPMKFRNDGLTWNFQPFNYGYRYKDSGTGKIINYTDPVTGVYGPVFLDASGGLLNGDGTTNGGSAAIIYPAGPPAGYQVLNGASWSGIGVPVNPFT